MSKPKLIAKPGQDPQRREHQRQVREALLDGQAFGLTVLLARVKDKQPYSNYRVPDDLARFEFEIKGLIRLEMMGDPDYKGWRRLFGSNTKARMVANWRSRVLPKAFGTGAEAQGYLRSLPLLSWPSALPCPLLDLDLTASGPYLVLQVHEVWLSDGRRASDFLADFLRHGSQALELKGEPYAYLEAVGGQP